MVQPLALLTALAAATSTSASTSMLRGEAFVADQVPDTRFSMFEASAPNSDALVSQANEADGNVITPLVHCETSEWGKWSACETRTLTETRERTITVEPSGSGKACPSLTDSRPCKPVHCDVSAWTPWSACDEAGFRRRTRAQTVAPKYGGTKCPHLVAQRKCWPGDCRLTAWSEWECDARTERKTRSRTVSQQASAGGEACPAQTTETAACDPIDCIVSDVYGEFSSCDKATGKRSRSLEVLKPAQFNGKPCDLKTQEEDCKVDCEQPFGPPSECDKKTGHITQTRAAVPLVEPKNNGAACPTDLTRTEKCDVDCELAAEYGPWSECDKQTGRKTRSRAVLVEAKNGGTTCPTDTVSETCAVNCELGGAETPATCSLVAGTPIRIKVPPKNGGTACQETWAGLPRDFCASASLILFDSTRTLTFYVEMDTCYDVADCFAQQSHVSWSILNNPGATQIEYFAERNCGAGETFSDAKVATNREGASMPWSLSKMSSLIVRSAAGNALASSPVNVCAAVKPVRFA